MCEVDDFGDLGVGVEIGEFVFLVEEWVENVVMGKVVGEF